MVYFWQVNCRDKLKSILLKLTYAFMKKQFLFLVILAIAIPKLVVAQKFTPLDKSPLDIVYFKSSEKQSSPLIKVIYSRPQKKGRTMIGGNEPYGKIWRTGANETTEIKLYKDVSFGGQVVKAGTYSLYTIPEKDKWTIIINAKLDTWGAYEYDLDKDVVRFEIPVTKSSNEVEAFSISFHKDNEMTKMYLAWENILIAIPFELSH